MKDNCILPTCRLQKTHLRNIHLRTIQIWDRSKVILWTKLKNSKVNIDFFWGGGFRLIIRDRHDFVSNRYSIAFPQLKIVLLLNKNMWKHN